MIVRACAGLLIIKVMMVSGMTQILPPVEISPKDAGKLIDMGKVHVQEFQFKGNTVFSDKDLEDVILALRQKKGTDERLIDAPNTLGVDTEGGVLGDEYSSEELEQVRHALTAHYVDHAYINSGVILPNQVMKNGLLMFQIVEGELARIVITGNERLRDGYLIPRIRGTATVPLNVNRLRQRIQILQKNQNVRRINAELKPGASPGESNLEARVIENNPLSLGLQFSNAGTPSTGAEKIDLLVGHKNLLGYSDALFIQYGILEKGFDDAEFAEFDNFSASYAIPVTLFDTTLKFEYLRSDSSIIEEPFSLLEITSDSQSYGLSLQQPLYRTLNHDLTVTLKGERRESESFLFGRSFSISPGSVNGKIKLSVLRVTPEWVFRSQKHVVAIRSTFNFGTGLDTTDDGSDRDGKFFSWLGQFQYVRRLQNTDNQLIMRLSSQLTGESLLSLEQFVIGGVSTVRGYRQNQLVRDNGVVASMEIRFPVIRDKHTIPILQVAPFFDIGGGWNELDSARSTAIASLGVGLIFTPRKHIRGELYYGNGFPDINSSEHNLQDEGVHFKLTINAF